jgi:hypothetical protein
MPLLIFLPIMTFLAVALLLAGISARQQATIPSWPRILIWSSAFVGTYLVLISEIVSLFDQLTPSWIVAGWTIPLLAMTIFALKTDFFSRGYRYWRDQISQVSSWPLLHRVILIALIIEVLLLLAVALKAAPNTADSLLYHMSRIAHWRQNHSLDHYAAIYNNQLWSPIFAELTTLHFVELWGSDAPANLIQFLSMVGSLALVAGISRQLGGRRGTQLIACLLAFSSPMMLLQATSNQNDYVVGYWSVATLYLLLRLVKSQLNLQDWLALGAVIGLGMLTKVTYYPYLGLLIIGSFALAWRRRYPVKQLLLGAAGITLLAVALNAGFWARNTQTYGTPLGAKGMIASNTRTSLDPRAPIARSMQHLALNYTSPWPGVNSRMVSLVKGVSAWLDQPSTSFEVLWGWNHEDLAGNPLHISILLISLAAAFWPGIGNPRRRWYAAALIVSFIGYSWVVDAGVHRVRYQVPWLLMGAPLSASIISSWLRPRYIGWICSLLLVLALPWIMFNQSRPVLGWQPHTRTRSVFLTSRAVSLFANAPRARQPFSEAAKAATANSCSQIGLKIDAIDIEYAFWWLLEQENSQVEIKIVQPLPELAQLKSPDFEPCSIICTNCQTDALNGLRLSASFNDVDVFK